jgi:hypothetical protein
MRKTLPLIALLSLCFTMAAVAQPKAAPASACPQVRVTAPATGTTGESYTVTVGITGGDPQVSPTYNWTISNGYIESGQGTSSITINTEEVEPSMTITATVDVGGYSPDCSTTDSSTTEIVAKEEEPSPAPTPEKPPQG